MPDKVTHLVCVRYGAWIWATHYGRQNKALLKSLLGAQKYHSYGFSIFCVLHSLGHSRKSADVPCLAAIIWPRDVTSRRIVESVVTLWGAEDD